MTDATTHTYPGGTGTLGANTVGRIGYGAMQLERLREDRDAAVALLRRAIELGVDHIDTAQFYGDGFVNGVIREVVGESRGVTVVTKIGADPTNVGPFPMKSAQRPEELRASVHANLQALDLDRIPVVNLRRMEVGMNVPRGPEQMIDLDDQLAEMIAMRTEGLIEGIGLSTITLESFQQALPAGIVCVQNAYSLLARGDDPLLELAEAEGIAWVPYFPLGSAFPGIPKVTDDPTVQEIAAALGATPSQVGLAWLLAHSESTLLIPGTSSIEHLEHNLAIGDVHLTAEQIAQLNAVVPAAPVENPSQH